MQTFFFLIRLEFDQLFNITETFVSGKLAFVSDSIISYNRL